MFSARKGHSVKIALIGYGKMGHMVEAQAQRLGHEIAVTVDPFALDAASHAAGDDLAQVVCESGAEGAIEFSRPDAAVGNIRALLPLQLPLVVGTTGWAADETAIAALAAAAGGTLVRSANFSLGVNLFYRIVEEAARIMAELGGDEYDEAVWECHHNQKADSPSGTALEIARRILAADCRKIEIMAGNFDAKPLPHQLQVASTRVGAVPGTHTVFFDSGADTIELTHTARSRDGFALGAVRALERLCAALTTGALKPGRIYGMGDLF
jgi:4-hydroxy-tetrahydrodipicolinate reductase